MHRIKDQIVKYSYILFVRSRMIRSSKKGQGSFELVAFTLVFEVGYDFIVLIELT